MTRKDRLIILSFIFIILIIGTGSVSASYESDSNCLSGFHDLNSSITSSGFSCSEDNSEILDDNDSLSVNSSSDSGGMGNTCSDVTFNGLENDKSSVSKNLENNSYSMDEYSLSSSTDMNIKSKESSIITVNSINAFYKEKSSLNINLKSADNNILMNRNLKIFLNGKTFIKKTDNKGNIKFLLNLKPGCYHVKILFEGDEGYKNTSANAKIKIKKAPLSIKTKNFSTYLNSDIFFTAKVINNITKNPVEGIKVLFNVYSSKNNYKNYYALTNKKGIATLNKNLKVGTYDIYTYLNDTKEKGHFEYENLKNKVVFKVKKTAEMGCSSIYVYVNENESAIAFRRDSTYAAKLYVVAQKWHGRYAIKQYKLVGTYFFHAITTSDGWLMGTGGWDNPRVNKKIENLAGKIVSTNSLKNSNLIAIRKVESQLPTGHFAIVAPDGRYAVVWKSGFIKGKLKKGEYLKVPNARSLYRHGNFKKFSTNPATAAHKIAATDGFGLNRRNIMTYHYKRVSSNYKTSSIVTVYGSNDKGNLIGRHTANLIDNVLYKKTFISKYKLSGTPYKKLLGTHKFGNIDNLIKTQTKLTAPKVTSDFNKTNYLQVTLRNKKTNNILKGVRINVKVTSDKASSNYVIRTNKYGVAYFNTKVLSVGTHNVTLSPANHQYMISGRSTIVINEIKKDDSLENYSVDEINSTD